jgi:hypothetical protein
MNASVQGAILRRNSAVAGRCHLTRTRRYHRPAVQPHGFTRHALARRDGLSFKPSNPPRVRTEPPHIPPPFRARLVGALNAIVGSMFPESSSNSHSSGWLSVPGPSFFSKPNFLSSDQIPRCRGDVVMARDAKWRKRLHAVILEQATKFTTKFYPTTNTNPHTIERLCY